MRSLRRGRKRRLCVAPSGCCSLEVASLFVLFVAMFFPHCLNRRPDHLKKS